MQGGQNINYLSILCVMASLSLYGSCVLVYKDYWDSSKAVYHDIQNRAGKSVKPVIYFELPKQSLNSG